jgi:hypothetical protein
MEEPTMAKERDLYLQAIAVDNTLPIDPDAVALWAKDLDNPLRWSVMPWLRLVLAITLHLTWVFKRMSPIQFSAHRHLQRTICWFCKHFVSPEGNRLLLRHFTTESNILNFLIDNTKPGVEPVKLYPSMLVDMMTNTFVDHDQELFRTIRDLGNWDDGAWPKPHGELKWDHWRPMDVAYDTGHKKWTQVLDFETGHVLFMCMFCLFLTRDEYRGAINGFNLDQSIALRIAKMVDDPSIIEMAYNKYPMYLLGPWNLTQRFLMHGFFTEFLHARLEQIRQAHAA